MNNSIITLTSDFGDKSGYVGVMKGVIYRLSPSVQIVDISHAITPQNIAEGAFLLHTTHRYFAPNTVHVAVVDPGVGTNRRAICVRVPEIGIFIAPDNGLLTYIIEAYPNLSARQISNPNFGLSEVSNTFHGRDIFSPTAALLAEGEPFEQVGDLINPQSLVRLPNLLPQWQPAAKNRKLAGFIIHIDQFGNLITNIPQNLFENFSPKQLAKLEITVPLMYNLKGIQKTYGDTKPGKLIALFGSSGFLEIARVNGSAAHIGDTQAVKPGKKVTVRAVEG
jgi:S-adenosyl-L-methionine hydrolase (adenosine-forming)